MSNKEKREAFVRGAYHIRDVYDLARHSYTDRADRNAAKAVYPPKTVTRPREIVVGTTTGCIFAYRNRNDEIEVCDPSREWRPAGLVEWRDGGLSIRNAFSREDAIKLLDLMYNPTETVEVDD
jgi:hypothetical protein